MDLEETLKRTAENLDLLTRIHLDNDHEYRERMDRMDARIEKLLADGERDAEAIRALARIAEIHNRRLTDLEGGPES